MVLYGYTYADAPVKGNNTAGGKNVPLFRFELSDPNGTLEQVATVKPFNGKKNKKNKVNFAYEDLEGLTSLNGKVIAVSESDRADANGDKGTIVQVNKARNLKGAVRFGTEAGAATLDGKVYNIQGSAEGTIGSSLYQISKAGSKKPVASLVAKNPSNPEKNGTAPVNSEYADSLTGVSGVGLIAGDFSTDDGTGNFLYVGVPTSGKNRGLLSAADRLTILDPNGNSGVYNNDAGLGSTPSGELFALLENGTLLTIDYTSTPGIAQVTSETNINDLNSLFNNNVDFEGFTIVDEV